MATANNSATTQAMSIYERSGRRAWPLATTPTNIMNAFNRAYISPENPDIFTDEDFAPSFVTDRPMPDTNTPHETDHNKEPRFQETLEVEESQTEHMGVI